MAIAKGKGNLIAFAFQSEKEQHLSNTEKEIKVKSKEIITKMKQRRLRMISFHRAMKKRPILRQTLGCFTEKQSKTINKF